MVYADVFSYALFRSCAVLSGFAVVSGGGFFVNGFAVLVLIDTAVTGHRAGLKGGGVYGATSAKVFCLGTAPPAASSTTTPGGVLPDSSAVVVGPSPPPSCALSFNTVDGSSGKGGGVFLEVSAFFWFVGCVLAGNMASSSDGGAIYSTGAPARAPVAHRSRTASTMPGSSRAEWVYLQPARSSTSAGSGRLSHHPDASARPRLPPRNAACVQGAPWPGTSPTLRAASRPSRSPSCGTSGATRPGTPSPSRGASSTSRTK